MPVFIAAFLGALIQAAGTLVGRVLLSLGIGYATFTGIDSSLSWVKGQIASSMAGLPAPAMSVLSSLQAGTGVAILVSAVAARLLLDGLTGGKLTRMVTKV